MKRLLNYKLVGKKPVPVEDLAEWAQAMAGVDRTVKKTLLPNKVMVSTVFLGLDHNWNGGPPILFETMVFGGPHNEYQERYATWDQAEKDHDRVVEALKAGKSPEL